MQLAKRFVKAGVSDIVLIAIIIMSIFPFIYMFMMSFKSTINAFDFDFSLDKLTLEQYVKVFQVDNFERYIFNSVFVAVAGVMLTLAVCSLAGFARAFGSDYCAVVPDRERTGVAEYVPGADPAAAHGFWRVYYAAGYSGRALGSD